MEETLRDFDVLSESGNWNKVEKGKVGCKLHHRDETKQNYGLWPVQAENGLYNVEVGKSSKNRACREC